MARRTKIEYITNKYSRKTTFKKRKKCLLKKVDELTTLCGAKACAIIYNPDEPQPEVVPNKLEAQRMCAEFKQMPRSLKIKEPSNPESLTRKRISQVRNQLKNLEQENQQMEITEMAYQYWTGTKELQDLRREELQAIEGVLDQKVKDIDMKIASLTIADPSSSSRQCLQLF